ncbi:hypothetical protein [Petralouisia muris]|uniref:hypothetical protein n=1 Tax=Petralouisia muris TaxID=3032872 RepID=UPI0038CDBBC8
MANANQHFKRENIEFVLGSPETINSTFDVLVSLETVEHLQNPMILKEMVLRCRIPEIIISFPRKKPRTIINFIYGILRKGI